MLVRMAFPLPEDSNSGHHTAFVFGELLRILGPVVSRGCMTLESPKWPEAAPYQ
jgi:hypothetical protein